MQPVIMTPDDNLNDIVQRPPEICVDYLSHEWNEEGDIWTSWRVMSKQKNEIANGIRLENASWRTWAKQKYKLKTVNPEKLNWLKDSDVTWLYGPLHTAWHSENEKNDQKSPTTEDEFNLLPSSTHHKSCLKKKSISETLRPRGRTNLVSSNSDTQLYKRIREKKDDDSDISDCDTFSTCSTISGPSTPLTGPTRSSLLPPVSEDNSSHHQHIRFNDQVEQCIAVDSADEDDDHYDSDVDSSSDEGLEMKISLKKKKKGYPTICKLAPTKLKSDAINYNVYSNIKRNTTTPSTSYDSTPSWMSDDDDDFDVDDIDVDMFDYFDLSTPSHSIPIIPSVPTVSLNHQDSGIIPRPQNGQDDQEQLFNKDESIDQGIVVRAVHIVHSVREIVNWCSSMVFNI